MATNIENPLLDPQDTYDDNQIGIVLYEVVNVINNNQATGPVGQTGLTGPATYTGPTGPTGAPGPPVAPDVSLRACSISAVCRCVPPAW